MSTAEAYDRWAEVRSYLSSTRARVTRESTSFLTSKNQVYDTDGNFLVALDTTEMRSLLPVFLARVGAVAQTHHEGQGDDGNAPSPSPSLPLKLIDLGCGTGRNTVQLLKSAPSTAEIVGLDVSPGMLAIAKKAVEQLLNNSSSSSNSNNSSSGTTSGPPEKNTNRVTLDVYDMLSSSSCSEATAASEDNDGSQMPTPPPAVATNATGIISTLVLEHVPARVFFRAVAAMLQPGGYLLVTNMHADMGRISQAGFIDIKTGKKIRPVSYNHEVKDVVAAARQEGFELVDPAQERAVEEGMVEVLGNRAAKWVGVTVWFGMCFQKKA